VSILVAKEIHCDGCGAWVRMEGRTIEQDWSSMKKDGWTRQGGRHYCKKCGLNASYENHAKEDSP
jgi:hypothetical protein